MNPEFVRPALYCLYQIQEEWREERKLKKQTNKQTIKLHQQLSVQGDMIVSVIPDNVTLLGLGAPGCLNCV